MTRQTNLFLIISSESLEQNRIMPEDVLSIKPKIETPPLGKPELKVPERFKVWTETGKRWLAKLREMIPIKPRKVVKEVAEAPEKEKEFVRERVKQEQPGPKGTEFDSGEIVGDVKDEEEEVKEERRLEGAACLGISVEKKSITPEGDLIGGGGWSFIYRSRINPDRVYRVLKPQARATKHYLGKDWEYALKDQEYKVQASETDKTGLVPRIYTYDAEKHIIEEEFVDGIQLTEYRGSLTQEQSEQLLDTLREFHKQGLYHGDIEAHHMILCSDGQIRLIDPSYLQKSEEGERAIKSAQLTDQARVIIELKKWGYKPRPDEKRLISTPMAKLLEELE